MWCLALNPHKLLALQGPNTTAAGHLLGDSQNVCIHVQRTVERNGFIVEIILYLLSGRMYKMESLMYWRVVDGSLTLATSGMCNVE